MSHATVVLFTDDDEAHLRVSLSVSTTPSTSQGMVSGTAAKLARTCSSKLASPLDSGHVVRSS